MPRFHDTCAASIGGLYLPPAAWNVLRRRRLLLLRNSWTLLAGWKSSTEWHPEWPPSFGRPWPRPQLLQHAQVGTTGMHVGGKGMGQHVRRHPLGAGKACRHLGGLT